jgi:hypothetical protein
LQQPLLELIKTSKRAIGCGHRIFLVKEVSEEMYQILAHSAELTETIDHYYGRLCDETAKLEQAISIARLEIQHCLLSFRTSQSKVEFFSALPPDTGASETLTELIRLAALIYNDLVFVPMPWRTGIRQRLSKRIRLIWEGCKLSFLSEYSQRSYSELYVWMLWFGALASFSTDDQDWFEQELRSTLEVVYGPDWDCLTFGTIKHFLCGCLWWDNACAVPGAGLWFRLRGRSDGTEPLST